MTATYYRDTDPAQNPDPLSFDCMSAAGRTVMDAALGAGPIARGSDDDGTIVDVLGVKLSPSPELNGAGSGVLEVDYVDGQTRTFDVLADGTVCARSYAYAIALVIETDEPHAPDGGWAEEVAAHLAHHGLTGLTSSGRIEYVSDPRAVAVKTGEYDVQVREGEKA